MIGVLIQVEIFLLLADVAGVTRLIPDLNLHAWLFLGVVDIEVVEPLLAQDVPTRRKHDDAAIGQRGEVMLNAPVAERVIDAMLLRLAGEIGFGDVVGAIAFAKGIRRAAKLRPCRGRNLL